MENGFIYTIDEFLQLSSSIQSNSIVITSSKENKTKIANLLQYMNDQGGEYLFTMTCQNNNKSPEEIISQIKELELSKQVVQDLYTKNILNSSEFEKQLSNIKIVSIKLIYPTPYFNNIYSQINNLQSKLSTRTKINISILISGISETDNKFSEDNKVENIELDKTVTSIKNNSFTGCSSLKKLIIPSSITSIEDKALEGLTPDTEIIIPSPEDLNASDVLFYFGSLYLKGKVVKQNYGKAVKYFEKSGKVDANMQFHYGIAFGLAYQKGNGIEQNYTKAAEYFESAGKLGNLDAFLHLGILYIKGAGVEKNYEKGIEYLRKSGFLESEYERSEIDNDENFDEFYRKHQKVYDETKEQFRKDLEDNPFEMTLLDCTVVAPNGYNKYEEIKSKIPEKEKHECFYYYLRMVNCLMYATDNIYHALMVSNGFKELRINEIGYVFCCKCIYNKTKIIDIFDNKENFGKPINPDIRKAFGIYHAFVGSSTQPVPFLPIDKSMIDKNRFCANEIIFPNKYQFIPFYSFRIMKNDHYILWKDDNIDNNENTMIDDLSHQLEVNIYQKKTVNDALELIKKKKYAYLKLIVNVGKDLSGKELIEKARKLIGSNFVCLVFDNEPRHMEWISNMENVLFTTNKNDFIQFAKVSMKLESIKDFISKLEESTKFKFKINDEQLLKFPGIGEISPKEYFCNIA